jgi:hypothetical protein
MEQNQTAQNDEVMVQLLARSATDADFRRKLVETPRAAFAEFTGRPESEFEHVNVRFVENKAQATFVLPAKVDPSAELSESELEAVAGGSPLILGGALLAGAILTAALIGAEMK